MPYWRVDDEHIKIPAAWLIETAGLKDYHDAETGMATWPTQALVFVNEHAKSTADLLKFKAKVLATIDQKFGITLEQEPELLP
jgi:UDP-N-acetylmuramate dehydrogenase